MPPLHTRFRCPHPHAATAQHGLSWVQLSPRYGVVVVGCLPNECKEGGRDRKNVEVLLKAKHKRYLASAVDSSAEIARRRRQTRRSLHLLSICTNVLCFMFTYCTHASSTFLSGGHNAAVDKHNNSHKTTTTATAITTPTTTPSPTPTPTQQHRHQHQHQQHKHQHKQRHKHKEHQQQHHERKQQRYAHTQTAKKVRTL